MNPSRPRNYRIMEFWNNLSGKTRIFFACLFLVIFCGSGFLLYPHFSGSRSHSSPEETAVPYAVTHATVYITGAVRKPGVYTLPQGSRVEKAIQAAGGASPDWDPEGINLAKLLEDEDMVVVPRKNQNANGAGPIHPSSRQRDRSFPKKSSIEKKVSLNRAGLGEFESLPGIGPGMARRIISYRETHGTFNSIEELRKVQGLGKKKLEKIKPYLVL